MRKLILYTVILLSNTVLYGQSVGLALSGGGAKGLYHIGVIKALEENGVPIDYIAGTSMGAIVAGFYAVGYSPDEMIDIVTNDNIEQWLTGKIDDKFLYYFSKDAIKPSLFSTNVNLKGLLKRGRRGDSELIGQFAGPVTPTVSLSSLISTTQLDLQFMNYFAAANSVAIGDFDKLFVPFRCVAANVVEKGEYTWSKGSLPQAIRSSMAIPIVFSPVVIDSMVLYDGGMYNNWCEVC